MNFLNKLLSNQLKLPIIVAVIYSVMGVITFINGLNGPFMMDDYAFFDNRKINLKNIGQQFIPDSDKSLNVGSQNENFYYRPFQHAMLMIAYHFFKTNTVAFHYLNLSFLILTAFMFYWFFRRIFDNHQIGFIAGLLFIIHPINGIVVNYITATVFTAQSLCIIVSLLYFWKSQTNINSYHSFIYFVISLLAFISGLLFHETALATPFYIAALVWIVLQQRGKKFMLTVLPFFAAALIYFLIRLKIASLATTILNTNQTQDLHPIVYLASFCKVIVWYLSKLIYPNGILFIWTTPFTTSTMTVMWVAVFVVLLSLFVYLITCFKTSKAIVLGLLWLAIGFLPVSVASLFSGQALMMEPHWMVFGSIGYFLGVSAIFSKLTPEFSNRKINCVFYLIVIALITVSFRYNYYWADEKRYCLYWLDVLPQNRTAQFFLAQRYLKDGNYEKAEPFYYKLLNGTTVDALMYSNLGVINIYKKNYAIAKKHLLKAYSIDANSDVLNNSLGIIAAVEGRNNEAKQYFEKAIEINKYEIVARINLSRLYLKEKNLTRAVQLLNEILLINPNHEEAMIKLWDIYIVVQNNEELKLLGSYILKHSTNDKFKAFISLFLNKI